MIPASFDYHAPSSLEEALALLGDLGEEAKLLAGGQSLIPAMRFRLAQPAALVDISSLRELDYIEERADHLAIGGLTRESALEESALVRERYPLLADTAAVIADPLVRNLATVGGNLAHADPANDHPATMLAYRAVVVAHGRDGSREIPIDDLFVDLFATSLAPGEILTEIRIPKPVPGSGGAYVKFERKVGDYAISAVAAQVVLDGGRVASAGIGLTNVSPTPLRARRAEEMLAGEVVDDELLEAAGRAAAEACDPSPDLRGSVEFKRDLTRVLTKRAIARAVQRAKGE